MIVPTLKIEIIENQITTINTSILKKNFGLTKLEFEKMVDNLKKGDERLFEKIFLSHFDDCMKYLISVYKTNKSLAYDITMDALILFRKKIIEDKVSYGNLRFLFTKIATQLFIKNGIKEKKINQIEFFVDKQDEFDDELILILEKAWSMLSDNERNLLNKVYYSKIPLVKIAEDQGKSDAALRKQKQRSMVNLRAYFLKIYRGEYNGK